MSVQQLLTRLRDLDVKLWVEDDKLRYSAPQGVLTDGLLSELASHKKEMTDWLNKAVSDIGKQVPSIEKASRNQILPASFAQERLLFIEQLVPETGSYNMPLASKLLGDLDIAALEKSLNEIVSRHEVLRTRFATRDGQHIQIIEPEQPIIVSLVFIADEDDVSHQVEKEISLPFNLATGPLLRCKLFCISEQEHILILTIHHIASDGWSLGILFNELVSFYNFFRGGEPAPFPQLPVQYADYALWQRQTLTGGFLEERLAYWRDNLNELATLQLPTDHPRPPVQNFQGGNIVKVLPAKLGDRLRALVEKEEATLFMVALATFAVLLHRYCGQDDIVVGTPIANRNKIETEGLIGFFINMLVLRTDLSGTPSFRELLARVKNTTLAAYQHQDLPFEKLVGEMCSERDLSRNPLFQVSFALQNAPLTPVQLKGFTIEPVPFRGGITRFDLEVNLVEVDSRLIVSCSYNSGLFEAATIDRMMDHYQQLLGSVVENPDQSIDELQLLKQEERHLLLREWNRTGTDYPRDKTVHELFETQAASTPDAIAVTYRDEELSYAELNARANQVAHYLQARGIGPEVMVGVCVERSLEMVTGLLGILKAGGAYVPVDLEYPSSRIAFMLEDAQVPVLLTTSNLREQLPDLAGVALCLDSNWAQIARESEDNPAPSATADSLAYVIYTSGSTGNPKGVEVTHGGLTNLVSWHQRVYEVSPADRATHLAGLGFDASVWELWPYLCAGASLYLVSDEQRLAPASLWPWMAAQGITLSFLPTSLAEAVLREPIPADLKLRVLLTGGDRLHGGLVDKALPFRVVNHYGPTENSVVATCTEVDICALEDPPIGRPIDNVQTYILDKGLQPVPVGAWGELYLGGESLARGYLNQPQLTAERFIANPFADEAGERLYRTGDRVRYRSDGAIEFMGRFDHQVKIRGFRIELGEIEAALISYPAIQDAVVIVREDKPGDKRLAGYLLVEDNAELAVAELRAFVRERLPNYMLPSAFMVLDSFPLTANGKLDRDALPSPDIEHLAADSYIAPQSDTEIRIAKIWCDLLGIEKSGTRDNFFDLGGHSLLMSQVQSRLNEEFVRSIPMLDLFQYPTIESLAAHLLGAGEERTRFSKARARMEKRRHATDESEHIAIISMAGRFPGAVSVEQFWENLANGVESIRFFTNEELTAAGIPDQLIENPRYVPANGFLDDAELFDAAFFGYPPHEAELLDPQQRLFLECAWEALERAGYDPERYPGMIGVYAGSTSNSYQQNLNSHPELVSNFGMQVFINSDKDFLPTRVSYKLNLRGPSVTVQTACSTSLVAIHEACKSLRDNECDIALAGGVSVAARRVRGYMYQEEGILSPDGHCRAFSDDARGTVGGEGIGIVVLKRLSEAQQDGDVIHAVIRGSAINNDGSNKVGYTAPSVEGQAEVIALAHAAAGVAADSISYVETHGTGTKLGDPIEMAGLARVFEESGEVKGNHCALGAIKTNIGHLDAAAGVAGVIKAALALENSQIPPSLNFNEPNPEIDFESGPFFVNTELRPWQDESDSPRRAGVSSFGIGGTNAHAVLEQAPAQEKSDPGREWSVFPVSAKNEVALAMYSNRYADYLERNQDANLADVSFTLRTGRGQFDFRRAVVGKDIETAIAGLKGESAGRAWTRSDVTNSPPVIFMFPGQGAQSVGMGQGLYESESVFREIVDDCCEKLKIQIDVDLRDIIFCRKEADPKQVDEQLRQTLTAQCSLFVIEYALARLWMSWGIQPTAMIGHSIGEYVAACVAGAIELDAALLLIASRGQAMQQAPEGAMLSVPLPESQLILYLNDELWLSVINGHSICVVSGTPTAIDSLSERLSKDGVEVSRLRTSGAFHSGLMDDVVPRLVNEASKLKVSSPRIPYISNVTGSWIEESQLQNSQYWGQHLRNTVRFSQGMDKLLSKFETAVFLEVGPGKTLTSLLRQNASDNNIDAEILSSLKHPLEKVTDEETIARAMAGLWLRGVNIDWQAYDQLGRRCRLELPTYPFQRQKYWVDPAAVHFLSGMSSAKQAMSNWAYVPAWKSSPMLTDPRPTELSGDWIVFANESVSCQAIIDYLGQLGTRVIYVHAADDFTAESSSNYRINPSRKEDYELLFSDDNCSPDQLAGIVHCWGINEARENNLPVATDVMQLEFYSLLYATQAMVASGKNVDLHIKVLTQHSQLVDQDDMLLPEKSMLAALLRVISQENIGIKFTLFDLLDEEIKARLSQQKDPTKLPDELKSIFDVSRQDNENRVVAFRRNRRWLQIYDRLDMVDARSDQIPVHLREQGVYLITGGLGEVGFVFANYLARELGARLVLTARTQLPERSEWENYLRQHDNSDKSRRIIAQVLQLEKSGAEVMVASVDVSDLAAMQKLVEKTAARFGQINGVVHAAGVVSGSSMASIQSLTYDDCEAQFAAKVYGLQVLKQLFDDTPLDFIMPVSSLSAVLGGLGFAAYSAANQFMDSLCQQQHNRGNTQWISVNWDGWLFDDIDENGAPVSRPGEAAPAALFMTASESKDVLRELLNRPLMPQVIISTGDLDARLLQWLYSQPGEVEKEVVDNRNYERPQLSSVLVEAQTPSQSRLSVIWQQLFKLNEIGINDNFFELGGHSLLAIQMIAAIREEFNTSIPIEVFLELGTIEKIASHLDTLEWVKSDAEEAYANDDSRDEFEL